MMAESWAPTRAMTVSRQAILAPRFCQQPFSPQHLPWKTLIPDGDGLLLLEAIRLPQALEQ